MSGAKAAPRVDLQGPTKGRLGEDIGLICGESVESGGLLQILLNPFPFLGRRGVNAMNAQRVWWIAYLVAVSKAVLGMSISLRSDQLQEPRCLFPVHLNSHSILKTKVTLYDIHMSRGLSTR